MERIRRNLSFANVAAALALVFSMSGGAIAATGGFTSGGKLQACVNQEGVIRLLKPGKKCKSGQATVAWNQAGPAGASGAQGVNGATGASGAAGAPGAKGVEGPKGMEGLKGTSGEATNVKWATVDDEGFIQSSHGAVAAVQSGDHFTVAFDQDVSKCALLATQNGTNAPFEVSAKPEGTEVMVTIREGNTFIATDFSLVAIC